MLNWSLSSDHLFLLKAAVFPPVQALHYWQAWLVKQQINPSEVDDSPRFLDLIDRIDPDSQRLMPLIYRNLSETSDTYVLQLSGIYRVSWLRNNHQLFKLQSLLLGLQAADVETILLKGIPLSLRYYKDTGVRMTSDVDFLVPTTCANKALELLQRPTYGLQSTAYETKHQHVLHAIHLFDPSGIDVDLHWNLMHQHTYLEADTPFWADKQPIVLPNGQTAYILSPTHQFFHNLVHGFHWGGISAIRWIPDCYVIYRDQTAVDWHALIDLTERYQMRIPVQQGLNLLMTEFGLTLPESVRHRLHTLPISRTERSYFSLLTQPSSNVLTKRIRYIRKIILAYQLFQRGKPGLSFLQYTLGHISLSLGWDKRDLPN